MPPEPVSIPVDGLELAGHLHRPTDGSDQAPPGIVISGPLTGVKEQVVGTYAERLAEDGFCCLAFDHRAFGESDGTPRQHEDPAGKLADLRAATSYLANRDDVDAEAIGALGVCLGTAYVLRFAAFDPRIKAVALVAGAYNDPSVFREMVGPEAYRSIMAQAADEWTRYDGGGTLGMIPAVSESDQEAAMPGKEPFDYYGTKRGQAAAWRNEVTRVSMAALMRFDAASTAPFVEQPVLFVHGEEDAYCPPEGARSAYDRAPDPKGFVTLPAKKHLDLYDVDEHVDEAVRESAAWFAEHLQD